MNRSGLNRPFIWNPRTDERMDLDFPGLAGEVVPLDWSHDGRYLLLCQLNEAIQQLHLFDLQDQTLKKLDHPSGTYGLPYAKAGIYFGVNGEIFAQWQNASHPTQLIALDVETGRMKRSVLALGDVPPGRPWRSISFPSSDGQIIQGWLGVPEGT